MAELTTTQIVIIDIFAIFAVLGFGVIYFRGVGVFIDLVDEAKKKDKRIEFVGFIVAFLALAISVAQFFYTLSADDRLSARISALEKAQTKVTP